MNLAVISDLHIGLAARSKDLCPEPPAVPRKDRAKYDSKAEDQYRHHFLEFVRRERITADYLLIPGDITNSAHPNEVRLASALISEVADAMGVSNTKIVFVPGNHDVDWSMFDPTDDTGIRWGQRYNTIGHNDFIFRRIVDRGEGNIFSTPHFIVWSFEDFLVVGYNSASHDAPIPRDVAHHGLADPAHIEELRAFLNHLGPPDRRVRLFLVHHHVLSFSDPWPRTPDFSLMTNAENLLILLHEYHFDFLIHGHRHHPRFETHSTHIYPHLPILCSGSFSVEIDTQWAGVIDNQFHLVTINGRTADNFVAGRITSWTNNRARGWVPSEEHTSGIHHIIPFGSYVMPRELDARLVPFITDWLRDHDHVSWGHVVDVFPDLEHLPISSAIAAFDRIAPLLGRQRMFQTLRELMLY